MTLLSDSVETFPHKPILLLSAPKPRGQYALPQTPEVIHLPAPVREIHCDECVNWFLGCLNGREKWGDKAITPNKRFIPLSDGTTGMLCDAFQYDPNPHRKGRVVFDDPPKQNEPKPEPCALCGMEAILHEIQGHSLCQPCADKVTAYAQRFEARLTRMRARADKAQAAFQSLNTQAHQMAEHIPFGQPILLGHHSERADRRYRDRIHSTFARAFDHFERANTLRQRADAAEAHRVISSDDPLAVVKLREKLAALEASQAHMKAVNATIRKHARAGAEAQVKALMGMGLDEKQAQRLLIPDDLRRVGYPDYRLTNNGADIRRTKARIEELLTRAQSAAALDTDAGKVSAEQHGDIRLERDADANRIRLHFPGKPSAEVIKFLKSNGFVWSPANTAWQRQLNNAGEYAAKRVIEFINR